MSQLNRKKRISAARLMAARWTRKLMKQHGTTISVLSSRCGIPRRTLSRAVKGKTAELRTLQKIAAAFGVEVPDRLRELAYKRQDWRGLRTVNGKLRCEFIAFENMHRRVSDEKHPQYHRYGGAGIGIDAAWENTPEGFERFLQDVGARPTAAHSLHRSPPTANYRPDTCQWADKRTQRIERRGSTVFEVNGTDMTTNEFVKQSEEDGFACVVRFKKDGTLKKRRKKRTNKDEAVKKLLNSKRHSTKYRRPTPKQFLRRNK